MPKVWIINKDLKKLYNASSGVEKEEKNQQTWLAWYIKRQNNRGIHWFFIKRPNSWQTPIIHLCITFVRGPLSVFTLATADPLRLHVFHYYVGYFNFFSFRLLPDAGMYVPKGTVVPPLWVWTLISAITKIINSSSEFNPRGDSGEKKRNFSMRGNHARYSFIR